MISNQSVVPSDRDILCGRGNTCFEHPGNRYFRVIVTLNLPKYANHTTTRKEKTLLVQKIVEDFQQDQRRFLRQEGSQGWFTISLDEARKKVGHAMRDATSAMERNLRPKTISTPKSSPMANISLQTAQIAAFSPPRNSKYPSPERLVEDDSGILDLADWLSIDAPSDDSSKIFDISSIGTDFLDGIDSPENPIEDKPTEVRPKFDFQFVLDTIEDE